MYLLFKSQYPIILSMNKDIGKLGCHKKLDGLGDNWMHIIEPIHLAIGMIMYLANF